MHTIHTNSYGMEMENKSAWYHLQLDTHNYIEGSREQKTLQQFLKIQHITSVTKGPYKNDFINATRMPQILCLESSILIKVYGYILPRIPRCRGCLGLKKGGGQMKNGVETGSISQIETWFCLSPALDSSHPSCLENK